MSDANVTVNGNNMFFCSKWLAIALTSLLLFSCERKTPKDAESKTTEATGATETNTDGAPETPDEHYGFDLDAELQPPRLPMKSGKFAPSLVKLKEEQANFDVLGEVEKCGECHEAIVDEWKDSVHALSSFNNPYYRVSFDDFVEKAGHEKGAFCGGCHDPMLTFDGAINAPVCLLYTSPSPRD